MLGSAVPLAQQFLKLDDLPDLVIATSMLNLANFAALIRPHKIPMVLYFHENQLTYPINPRQKRQAWQGYTHYISAMVAERLFFNSQFHADSFFDELPRLLKHFPDYNQLETVDELVDKAQVLPVGVDLRRFDEYRCQRASDLPPLILWNHRWDYDKNPSAFFKALYQLVDEGYAFELALLGENTRQDPAEFELAREKLGERIIHYGYAEDFSTYAHWLWQADVVVSTARQDFFGISVVEAVYCGCWPILVNRLNYPALIPPAHHKSMLFRPGRLFGSLRHYLDTRPITPPELSIFVSQFDWLKQAPVYDSAFADVMEGCAT